MKLILTLSVAACVLIVVPSAAAQDQDKYLLLATNRTGTMQEELNEAPPEFNFVGMKVFSSTFGGREAAVILEAEIVD